jgi:hypothetical protein
VGFRRNYVAFMTYLRLKDETEYTGGESHVREKLRDKDMTWLPRRTCRDLEDFKRQQVRGAWKGRLTSAPQGRGEGGATWGT